MTVEALFFVVVVIVVVVGSVWFKKKNAEFSGDLPIGQL